MTESAATIGDASAFAFPFAFFAREARVFPVAVAGTLMLSFTGDAGGGGGGGLGESSCSSGRFRGFGSRMLILLG